MRFPVVKLWAVAVVTDKIPVTASYVVPFFGVILLFIWVPDFTVIASGNDRINLCSDGLKVCGKLLTTPVLV